ncbi:supwaprin-a [Nematostella vectensis]|uniref:supwaprin-a n=1 Tax=Nematostella vectensis TaxID=45351 RepID=UPI0020779A92|nr:supwaprin-a [Nematostella vectensis]XP_048584022.1 supwaprin-a [Nematostella vectensis]
MASLPSCVLLVSFLTLWTLAQGQVVPGTCPTFPAPQECPPEPDNECENDAQCTLANPGLGLKCCKDGCDLRCVPPIPPPTPPPQRSSGLKTGQQRGQRI